MAINDQTNNPDKPIDDLNQTDDFRKENYEPDPWKDKSTKKPYIESNGHSTVFYTKGKAEREETYAFHSGIGDNDDLLVKKPNSEEMELPFQYAARYRGKKKHETKIYPEIPFKYGIHYEGDLFVTDNEEHYKHRVDAHPGKLMEFSVTETDPQPEMRSWSAQLLVEGTIRQETLEYAVNWSGVAAKESVTGAADLFTSAKGDFIGPGPTTTWIKDGSFVKEIDNRSHASGIIAKEFYNWNEYEAEFEFKPIKSTGIRNDPLAKRVTSDGRLISAPGCDNDVLGFIFKAQPNKKDFYIFLWEGNETMVSSWRPKSLNGYNMLTGGLTSGYSHDKAEQIYERFVVRSNLATFGISNFYSGMKLTSSQLAKYHDFCQNQGWGTQHYRVYKVTNGVMKEVNVSYKGNGKGWIQDWDAVNWKNSVKIRIIGTHVKIYTASYKQGTFDDSDYQLAVEFDVPSNFQTGSVGLATFSQSVQFEKIAVTRWENFSGRMPTTGWDQYKDPGTKTLATTGAIYVHNNAFAKAKQITGMSNPAFEITSVTPVVKDPSKGTCIASAKGPVKVTTFNPPNAGQTWKETLEEAGEVLIPPTYRDPNNAYVVFNNSKEIFTDRIADLLRMNPDRIITNTTFKLVRPDQTEKDWDLQDEKLTMWNSDPEVIVTKKDFSYKVYAYQGWVQALHCRDVFNGKQWATYEVEYQEETVNPQYDQIVLKDEIVYMKTNEWYKGIYPADIQDEGVVTNKADVFVQIPPMPEHYQEPNTGEVMFHGYEDVRFLLTQITPEETDMVWMGFESKFDQENTLITSQPINYTTGKPAIWTDQINDRVQIHCKEYPHYVPWNSGKYIGYGKVNGKRPFFTDGAGKSDMVDVPTDVVFIPENVENLRGPFIEVDDERVQWELTGDTIHFWSDFMDAYIWYTDWYTDWKPCDQEFIAKSNEILTIQDPIELDPAENPYYNKENTIIEKVEVMSNNPFVEVWAEADQGEENGLYGTYYRYPIRSEVYTESFQVQGDYHEKIQPYRIKSYMTEVRIPIQETTPFEILSVKQDGETIPKDSGWTLEGNEVVLHDPYIKASDIEILYKMGDIQNEFRLTKPVGKGIIVYVNGAPIDRSEYQIVDNTLIIQKELLSLYQWVHIQSYIEKEPFDPNYDSYLGEYVGTRIDEQIWFNWGYGSPFPLEEMSSSSLSVQPMETTPVSDQISFNYDLDMEITYPAQETLDISNFTGKWVEWNQDPIVQYDDDGNAINGPGDWHGPPEIGYSEVTNLRNQDSLSGWYNPTHINLTDYEFQFKVQARSGDDDMYGAIFRFDPETQNFYSFEWDAYWSINSGGTGVRGMSIYKNICQNPQDAGVAKLNYTRTVLAHADISWTANAAEVHEIHVKVVGNTIKVWTDNILRFDIVDNDNPLLKGAWGPVTQSQPDTYFWDFHMTQIAKVTPNEDSSFRKHVSLTMDRPIINENPMIEIDITQRTIQDYFQSAIDAFLTSVNLNETEVEIHYFIRNDQSDESVYFNVNKGTEVQDKQAKVMTTVLGKEPPEPTPINHPIPNEPEPTIPPMMPPTQGNPNDGFAISWRGYIRAPKTGFYDFNVIVNDGFRLWVNNKLIIDEWHENMFKEYTGTIYLEGNRWYPIKAHYMDNVGQALVWLRWKMPGDYLRRIDSQYVSPYLGYKVKAKIKETTPFPWHPLIHNGYYYFHEKERYLYANPIHYIKEWGKDIVDYQVDIQPRPQQGSPIIVRDKEGTVLRKVTFYDPDWNLTLENTERFNGNGYSKYYLSYQDIDPNSLKVKVNGIDETNYLWNQTESSLQFMRTYGANDVIEVKYKLLYSYYIDMNHDLENDVARIVFHDAHPKELLETVEIIYEGSEDTPFYRATEIVSNPILNHNHRGFLYLTNTLEQETKNVTINVSPKRIGNKGNEKVLITGIITDQHENPIMLKTVNIYRDGKLIYTGTTNEAGEIYVYDVPPVPEKLVSYYTIECDGITNMALLNFFIDQKDKRAYLEMKAEKSTIIAGTNDAVTIQLTLRDYDWYIIPNQTIHISYTDTNGILHEEDVIIDDKGQATITLSGENQQHGFIAVKASYNMGDEYTENFLYIKVIGG